MIDDSIKRDKNKAQRRLIRSGDFFFILKIQKLILESNVNVLVCNLSQ
jgi:hypothetical protein